MVSSTQFYQLVHRTSTGVNKSNIECTLISAYEHTWASLGHNLVSDAGLKGDTQKWSHQGHYIKSIFQCFPFCIGLRDLLQLRQARLLHASWMWQEFIFWALFQSPCEVSASTATVRKDSPSLKRYPVKPSLNKSAVNFTSLSLWINLIPEDRG